MLIKTMSKLTAVLVKKNPFFAVFWLFNLFVATFISAVFAAIYLGFFGTFWWFAEGKDMGEQWTIVKPVVAGYNIGIHFGQMAIDVGYVYDEIDCDCTPALE